MQIGAQPWATRQITFLHAARYRELYLEEKGNGTGSKHNSGAQRRARARLIQEFRDDYRRLYREARDRGMLDPAGHTKRNLT